jgi:hypothetical protein
MEGQTQSNILLAMPIFKDDNSYRFDKVIENLKIFWNFDITDIAGDDEAAVFNINGETISLANVSIPIPQGDIYGAAKYAYIWPSALRDLKDHTGHAIVSVMTSENSVENRFSILSKVLSSILMTTDAVGVYQGSQSLLIPRKQYLSHIEELKDDGFPLMLWIYIGLRNSNTGNSAYTYGLKDFEKSEIEIVNSKLNLEELFDLLYNISSYIISANVALKNGETIGITAEQKIQITLSKGQFVEGQSIKLSI